MKNSEIKKINVSCYIYDTYNERGMKTFERKVAKLLKENSIFGEIICHNSYMEREGSGSYSKVIEIEVNKESFYIKEFTHDSEFWDNWTEPKAKDKRNLFLAVLENKINNLIEQFKN